VPHLHRAATDCLEDLERRHQFATCKNLYLQPAIGRFFDSLGKILNTDAQPR
jgi:hypothetical protein